MRAVAAPVAWRLELPQLEKGMDEEHELMSAQTEVVLAMLFAGVVVGDVAGTAVESVELVAAAAAAAVDGKKEAEVPSQRPS